MPVRIAIIKNSGNNGYWRGCGEIGMLLHCWWECKLIQPLWMTVWQFLNLEWEIPFDPVISLLAKYPKDYKSFCYRDTFTHMFTTALFIIAKTGNQSKCPSLIDWIKRKRGTYIPWNTMQQSKMMSSCHLKGHGWIWRTSFSANWHKNRKWNTAYSHS